MLVGKASLETLSRLLGNPGTDILLAFWGVPTSNPIKVGVCHPAAPPPKKKLQGKLDRHIHICTSIYAYAQGAKYKYGPLSDTPTDSAVLEILFSCSRSDYSEGSYREPCWY